MNFVPKETMRAWRCAEISWRKDLVLLGFRKIAFNISKIRFNRRSTIFRTKCLVTLIVELAFHIDKLFCICIAPRSSILNLPLYIVKNKIVYRIRRHFGYRRKCEMAKVMANVRGEPREQRTRGYRAAAVKRRTQPGG